MSVNGTLTNEDGTLLEPIARLNRDIRQASVKLEAHEARFLVDYYYQMQDMRIRTAGQIRSMGSEPHAVLDHLLKQTATLERQIRGVLDVYTDYTGIGRWAKSIVGIGPVLAAGLDAHIDITKAPTAGHIWRFAGYDGSVKWLGKAGAKALMGQVDGIGEEPDGDGPDEYAMTPEEVEQVEAILAEGSEIRKLNHRQLAAIARLTNRKIGNLLRIARDSEGRITRASMLAALARRPWNARLKVLCWKIGESFIKTQNHPDSFYGRFYIERRALEEEKNERGEFAEDAARILSEKSYGKNTEAYKWYSQGKLPPAHLLARARRHAVKIFLSHYHHVAYLLHYRKDPPRPYVIEHMGHVDYVPPPNLDLVESGQLADG